MATVCTLLSLASSYWAGMGKGHTEGTGLCRGLLPPRLEDSCNNPTKDPRSVDSLNMQAQACTWLHCHPMHTHVRCSKKDAINLFQCKAARLHTTRFPRAMQQRQHAADLRYMVQDQHCLDFCSKCACLPAISDFSKRDLVQGRRQETHLLLSDAAPPQREPGPPLKGTMKGSSLWAGSS